MAFLIYALAGTATAPNKTFALLGDTPSFTGVAEWTLFLLILLFSSSLPVQELRRLLRIFAILASGYLLLSFFYPKFPLPFSSSYSLSYFLFAFLPLFYPLRISSLIVLIISLTSLLLSPTLGLSLFFLLSLVLTLFSRLALVLPLILFASMFSPWAFRFFPSYEFLTTLNFTFFGYHFILPALHYPEGFLPLVAVTGIGFLVLLLALIFFPWANYIRRIKDAPLLTLSALWFTLFFLERWEPNFFFFYAFVLGALYASFFENHRFKETPHFVLPAIPLVTLLLVNNSLFLISSFQAGKAIHIAHQRGLGDAEVGAWLKKAISTYPFSTLHHTALAVVYLRQRRTQEASSIYLRLLRQYARPELYWRLAQTMKQQGRFQEAREAARRVLHYPFFFLPGGASEYFVFIGDTLFEEGAYEKALIAYKRAAQSSDLALLKIGLCYLRLKQANKALKAFYKVARRTSNADIKTGALMNAGIVQLSLEQKEKAMADFQEALKYARSDVRETLNNYLLVLRKRR